MTFRSRILILDLSVFRLSPEKLRRLDLITLGCSKGCPDQRRLDRSQHPVIEADRRQIRRQSLRNNGRGGFRGIHREFGQDCRPRCSGARGESASSRSIIVSGDDLVEMQRRDPADQILKFADIAGPTIGLEALERVGGHLLARQALALGLRPGNAGPGRGCRCFARARAAAGSARR